MADYKEKKDTMLKRKYKAVLSDMYNKLLLYQKLFEEGKADEAKEIINKEIKKTEVLIKENTSRKRDYDISLFPGEGEKLFENNNILLKRIHSSEKDNYIKVIIENGLYLTSADTKEYEEKIWEDCLQENALYISIYRKEVNQFIGYCEIKDLSQVEWEIAIELLPEYQNKGYGTEAINNFIYMIYKLTGNRYFRVRIEIDNVASQKLFKKVGAYPNGISEYILTGELFEKFRKENMDSIDNQMREVAKEFCMEPEDILGYVLEYRIDMEESYVFRR